MVGLHHKRPATLANEGDALAVFALQAVDQIGDCRGAHVPVGRLQENASGSQMVRNPSSNPPTSATAQVRIMGALPDPGARRPSSSEVPALRCAAAGMTVGGAEGEEPALSARPPGDYARPLYSNLAQPPPSNQARAVKGERSPSRIARRWLRQHYHCPEDDASTGVGGSLVPGQRATASRQPVKPRVICCGVVWMDAANEPPPQIGWAILVGRIVH